MNNLAKLGFLTGAVVFGTLIASSQQANATKNVKVISNVPNTSTTNVDTQNAALTGKNKIYTKAGVLKNAKQVTSETQLKKLKDSQRSKDFFNVYRMAVTNKHQVYYKVVSFEGKWRGWIYGGRVKNDYQGGLASAQTTKDLSLSDDMKNAKFKLKNPGNSGTDNTWKNIPWSKYHAKINTMDSSAYANDELQVTAIKQQSRQYHNTYYYVTNANHPEFNGWIDRNSVAEITKPAPATTTNNNDNNNDPKIITNTVTNTVTKTVTVPAKNDLSINYIVNSIINTQNQSASDVLIKAYQSAYATVLSEVAKDPGSAYLKIIRTWKWKNN